MVSRLQIPGSMLVKFDMNKVVLVFLLLLFVSCDKSGANFDKNSVQDTPDCANEYFGLYVGPPCAIPNAEFFSVNVQESPSRLDGGEVWFLNEGLVVYGDTSLNIKYCQDDRFHICILEPLPFLLPKNIRNSFSAKINGVNYPINIHQDYSEEYKKSDLCEYKSLKFEVIDGNNQVYKYYIFKNYGLKYYSIKAADTSYQTDMHNVKGTVFAYNQFCE